PPVASVTVSPATASVQVAASVPLTATLKDASGLLTSGTVTWASNNAAVATVLAGGVVTGIAVGTATVRATSGVVSGSAAISVVAGDPLYTSASGTIYS